MAVVVFGANGRTGRILTQRLVDDGRDVVAVTRNPGDFPVQGPTLHVAKADVREAGDLVGLISAGDAVLSALGVTFTRAPIDTYSLGVTNIISAMNTVGARRLAVISSTGPFYQPPKGQAPASLRFFQVVIANFLGKTLYDDVKRMETVVRGSGLDWTIVRPNGLFYLDDVTDYVVREGDPIGGFTSRTDLADCLATQAFDDSLAGKTVSVSTVENTPSFLSMVRREAFSGS